MKLSNRFAKSAGFTALSLTILVSSLLTVPQSSYAATPITVGGAAVVTNTDGDKVNVRDGAGTTSDKVTTAREGDTVTVLAGPKKDSSGNTWYKVQAPGGTGWVSADYLDGKSSTSSESTPSTGNTTSSSSATSEPAAKLTGFAVVANTDGDPLRMRSAASKDGKIITTLAPNTSVAIKQGPLTDTSNTVWYQVSANGITGWVMGQYLAQASAPAQPAAEQKPVSQSKPAVEAKPAVADTKPVDTKPVVAKSVEKPAAAVAQPAVAKQPQPQAQTAVQPQAQTAVQQPQAQTAVQPASDSPADSPATSGLGDRVVSIGLNYVGYRYVFGGTSPSSGFDCSGFIYYVYNKAGYPLKRDMMSQWNSGARISRDNLAPGDIVFWSNTYKPGLSHSGIYIGGGKFVHAENESTGVVISSMNTAYWASRYTGAVRPSK